MRHNIASRLDADSLRMLGGRAQSREGNYDTEMKSVRSKRSLSINVNKVSKITRLNDDGSTAITKASRQLQNAPADTSARHKSCGRVFSRGQNNAHGTAIFERQPPLLEPGAYGGGLRKNNDSLEELRSYISKSGLTRGSQA